MRPAGVTEARADQKHFGSAMAQGEPSFAKISALVIEPRCHPALPLIVWNMRRQLPSLTIQLFYSSQNKEAVLKWFANVSSVILKPLPSPWWNGMSHDGYSQLL